MSDDHFLNIYAHQAEAYDRLVGREDQRGLLFAALMELCRLDGTTVVEFGAGTGRLTRLLSLMARRVYAFDFAFPMLAQAQQQLTLSGLSHWRLAQADNRAMPLPAGCADVVIEGWSFGHAVGWSLGDWRVQVGLMLDEMRRLLKPHGTAILIETLGTGQKQPSPPTEGLAQLYRWWQEEHGFQHRWVRTDYQFESVDEAEALLGFFFGPELAARVRREQLTILPECTGIWWRTY
ncbi:MAG: class I SAM-dependent methyltransferase [Anaerolineae bacterium]|nr:class I SAM-dependent methyltransferase [Anaerolineae bacterium]MDW8172828.1 class I SAM-dependent methyltransferase [Anaerolineae bacterium]